MHAGCRYMMDAMLLKEESVGEVQEAGTDGGGGSQEARPADWRERMRQRQKYWSLSQGFRFGRKLADWGREGDDDGFEGGEAGAGVAGSQVPPGAEGEDAHLQEAIRRSLMDATGDRHACLYCKQTAASILIDKKVDRGMPCSKQKEDRGEGQQR